MEGIEHNCLMPGCIKRKIYTELGVIHTLNTPNPLRPHFYPHNFISNSVIKARFNNVLFVFSRYACGISPLPPSGDPRGCRFQRVSGNGRRAALQQEAGR